MLFYQVGELFQSYAVDQSRKSITSLMDIRPDYANIEVDGQLRQVDPEDVAVGDTIVIKAGERIPLDGVVLEGTSNVDTAALTGESLPREAQPGDDVISGCVNLSGLLRVRVTKAFEESTVAKILDLVENSSSKKAKAEKLHHQVRPVLHPRRGAGRSGSGPPAPPVYLHPMGGLHPAGFELPGGLLPLRPGHLRPLVLLRRHRRGL